MKEIMQHWLLLDEIKWDDATFINECGIDYTLYDPADLGSSDSGWCDASTGHRIPTKTMRITFLVENDDDLLLLKLKFGDNLIRHINIDNS